MGQINNGTNDWRLTGKQSDGKQKPAKTDEVSEPKQVTRKKVTELQKKKIIKMLLRDFLCVGGSAGGGGAAM